MSGEHVAPKVFLSYSWTDAAHIGWVEALATRLNDDGVHVIFDQWDLKKGHDTIVFMEKIVTDPDVKRVLCVCDRLYAEKADGRKGGVGTESQIISKELYNRVIQEKFVALVREKDSVGKAYLPVFFQTRLYYDFSDNSKFEEEYEHLLRDLLDAPRTTRPPLGRPPGHILLNNSGALTTASSRHPTDASSGTAGDDGQDEKKTDAFLDDCYRTFDVYRDKHQAPFRDAGIREIGGVILGSFQQPEIDREYLWGLGGTVRLSGWRPFAALMNVETAFGPVVFDDVGCEAFEYVTNAFKSLDFARIESTGHFYYAEALRDDLSEHVRPKDQFDFVIETARITEVLATILVFAKSFCGAKTTNQALFGIRWRGLAGRLLSSWSDPTRGFVERQRAVKDQLTVHATVPIGIETSEIGP
jgi:hypothetical protein